MSRNVLVAALAAAFFCTGVDGLLVEQAAEKLLSTIVGASTPAGAIVLAVYFGGLALGGFLSSRIRRRFTSPLVMYAALEAVVAVFALVLGTSFGFVQNGLLHLVALGGDSAPLVFALRLVAAGLWLLVPTIAMGATYPAVVDALAALGVERVTVAMARLYAVNLSGAVVSAFLGPYVVITQLGVTGALVAVGVAQCAVVVAALLLARAARPPSTSSETLPPQSSTTIAAAARPLLRALAGDRAGRVLLVAAFASGFVVFSLEVLWVQLIGAVVGMSVYAFAQMLGVVLLGLFLGGAIVSWVTAKRDALPAAAVPVAFLVAAAAVGVTGAFWDDAPLWLLAAAPDVTGFADGERVRLFAVLRLIGPAALALGLVYPALFRSGLFAKEDAAGVAGVLGGVNALGSIGGSLVAAFVLIPRLGTEISYRLLALALALLGVGLALAVRRARPGARSAALPVAAAGVAVVAMVASLSPWDPLKLTSGINVYFALAQVRPGMNLSFWAEDAAGGITTVVEDRAEPPIRVLLSNGKFQGNDGGEIAEQIGFALIPCALTSSRERALAVGLGTGQTAEVLAAAGFRHVEVAEISAGIVQAARARFTHVNRGVLDDPRVTLTIDDARNHLLRSDRAYDVISMEISSIWFAGSASLYSRQFYELARDHLAPHGVLQQWLQFHHIAPEEIASAVATMRQVFPHVALYRLQNQGILVGSMEPLAFDDAALADLAARGGTASEARGPLAADLALLQDAFGIGLADLPRHRLLDDAGVDRLVSWAKAHDVPVNTDENRWLEMATPRHNLDRVDWTKKIDELLHTLE